MHFHHFHSISSQVIEISFEKVQAFLLVSIMKNALTTLDLKRSYVLRALSIINSMSPWHPWPNSSSCYCWIEEAPTPLRAQYSWIDTSRPLPLSTDTWHWHKRTRLRKTENLIFWFDIAILQRPPQSTLFYQMKWSKNAKDTLWIKWVVSLH